MKDELIRLRISSEMKEKVQEKAQLNGLNVSAYISMLIANNINEPTSSAPERASRAGVNLESVSTDKVVGKSKGKRKREQDVEPPAKDWEPTEDEIKEWMETYSLPRKLAIVQIKSRRLDG